MKYNEHFYPYNPNADMFPVYLTGVGGSEYQEYVDKPEGYYWHQILNCESGYGTLRYYSEADQEMCEVRIEPGDYFFLPKGWPHKYFGDEVRWDVRWVTFDGYAVERMLGQFGMKEPFVLKSRELDTQPLEEIFEQMIRVMHTNRLFGSEQCAGLAYRYFLEFHMLTDRDNNPEKRGRMNILLPVIAYVEENIDKDFSITNLAEVAGVTHQHLCRLFKEAFNRKPNEYVARRRIDYAKKLMAETSLSLSEISERAGFVNAAYFSTVFRRMEGINPNEFRKNMNR